MADSVDFENLVANYYGPPYQFAFSLTRDEPDSCDLVQETFCIWANKGHQLRDLTTVKTWLFTTLHRKFPDECRKESRFPHVDLDYAAEELPAVPAATTNHLDSAQMLAALSELDENHRAPVALFYLQDCSYNEIAEILGVPIGTVKSRLRQRRIRRCFAAIFPSQPADHRHLDRGRQTVFSRHRRR